MTVRSVPGTWKQGADQQSADMSSVRASVGITVTDDLKPKGRSDVSE